MDLEELKHIDVDQMKVQLLKLGVDQKLLEFIEKIPIEAQQGLYKIFLEIVEDELLFMLALTDMDLSDEYLLQKNPQTFITN